MSIRLMGKNTLIYATGNLGLRAASFLLIPIYTHLLSIENYGLLMILLLAIQFMIILMSCGMEMTLLRFAKEYEREGHLNELVGTSGLINILGGLAVTFISLTALTGFFRQVLHLEEVRLFVFLACCISLVESLNIHLMTYYRAQNRPIRFMIIGLGAAGVLLVTSYISIYILRMGITGALLAKLLTCIVVFSVLCRDVLSQTGLRVSVRLVPKLLRFGSPLIFSMSGNLVIGGASIYFLSMLAGLGAVAIFSLGYKFASVLSMAIILPFQLSFKPFVFANLNNPSIKKQISQLLTYLILAISAFSFLIIIGTKVLFPFIAPPEYGRAYSVIIFLLPGIAFTGLHYFAETLFNIVKKNYLIGIVMAGCALFSVLMNYILIRSLGWYGAIAASNMSFMLVGSTLFVLGVRNYPFPIEIRRTMIAVMLFAFIILLNITLLGTDYAEFLLANILAALAILFILYYSSFCCEAEKLLLRNALAKARSIIS